MDCFGVVHRELVPSPSCEVPCGAGLRFQSEWGIIHKVYGAGPRSLTSLSGFSDRSLLTGLSTVGTQPRPGARG